MIIFFLRKKNLFFSDWRESSLTTSGGASACNISNEQYGSVSVGNIYREMNTTKDRRKKEKKRKGKPIHFSVCCVLPDEKKKKKKKKREKFKCVFFSFFLAASMTFCEPHSSAILDAG